MRTATDLHEAVEAARQGQRVMLHCPNHDDGTPSLSVSPGTDQPVVLKCMASCETEDILEAAGLSWADISNEKTQDADTYWTPNGRASHIYPYHLHDGTLEYEVLRVPTDKGKRFFQRKPDPTAAHGYRWNVEGVTKVPYRLPQVIAAVQAGRTIWVAEGEKCVHALLGAVPDGDEATTNPGGAGRWRPEYGNWMAGANIVICADSDDVGREHAREVRGMLLNHGCTVSIVEAPPGRKKNGEPIHDVADHLEEGLSLDLLLETTPDSNSARVRTAVDVLDIGTRPDYQFEFVIPGILARSERLLLVGYEGHGKSLMCRQIATCVAAGINPFTLTRIEPKRVLYIDAENHPGQTLGDWKRLIRIARTHGDLQPGMLHVLEEWDSAIDLANVKGRTWLKERIHAYRPELVILGPLKNLVEDNLASHETVNLLRRCINEARAINECAVIMEHHAPLRMAGDKKRELRPYGSGLFLGWPDFGYAMEPTEHDGIYEWRPFRGDRVRGRNWPEGFRWGNGNELPFEPYWFED